MGERRTLLKKEKRRRCGLQARQLLPPLLAASVGVYAEKNGSITPSASGDALLAVFAADGRTA